MDPEAVKSLVERCLRRLGEEVERYGGRVDKYIGDNVMSIFGAPVAHEDDAERAVRAALGMQAAMAEINDGLDDTHGVSFALRVGVNTGEVLAGSMGREYTVIGDTVNVASRLETASRPGQRDRGRAHLPRHARRGGVPAARGARAEGQGRARARLRGRSALLTVQPLGRALGRNEAPLVGRGEELRMLESLYGRVVSEGRPHLVTVVGQAGVGKTRLQRELESALGAQRRRRPRCARAAACPTARASSSGRSARCCAPSAGSSTPTPPTWPGRSCTTRVEELSCGGDTSAPPRSWVACSASRRPGEPPLPDAHDPQRMRESFFAAVRTAIEAMARRNPLVLVFEDIHWADQGMLDLIEHLGQWVRGPLLILCLARDELLERRPGWGGGRRGATSIFLEPLTATETRELIASLMPRRRRPTPRSSRWWPSAPAATRFFVEEMVRLLAEEGGNGGSELPDTVQGLLAARLDSLEPFERRLVQHAAVVGRTFWQESLAAVADEERARPHSGAQRPPGEGHLRAGRGQRARRRARAGVQARADPRRGLRRCCPRRCAPRSTSRWAASWRSAPATAATRWWRCSPSTTGVPRRSAARRAWSPTTSSAPS